MWYGICKSQSGKVIGFIVDENEIPIEYESEEQAYDSLKDHAYFMYIDIIEID